MCKSILMLLVLCVASPALAQEEPLPAPPPGTPVPPPPAPQPAPQQPYFQPALPGYQPYYPTYPPPYVQLEPNRTAQRFALYFEVLGKTFLWGLGMDVNITSWLGFGTAFTYWKVGDWKAGLVAPYVALYPAGSQKHAMVIHAGPEILFGSTKSSVFDIWGGNGSYVIGQLFLGYEYRNHVLIRPGLTFLFSGDAFLPWPGVAIGGAF